MYTKTLIASILASLAAAAPAPVARDNSVFAMIVIHSGSPIQGAAISENGLKFWISKPTETYCPESVEGKETALSVNNDSGLAGMHTTVPGGQLAYVTEDGQFSVTQAHSAAIPAGASQTGFKYNPQPEAGMVGELLFNGQGLSACPTGEPTDNSIAIYQIYANGASGFTQTNCTGITIGTAEVDAPPV
ncbi:hypothetical protein G7Y89_g913 [Cudoniella acicularis]|uniref:Uncharacterized protein n=1 Tax=Cudoniella acicularis TaxID=354080 RepID=A0A8H4RW98_9HELO|nr:hypothetical protein G7Y89_g913 [Cudoniella acicularis]